MNWSDELSEPEFTDSADISTSEFRFFQCFFRHSGGVLNFIQPKTKTKRTSWLGHTHFRFLNPDTDMNILRTKQIKILIVHCLTPQIYSLH